MKLTIKVTPRAKRNQIRAHGDIWKISVTAPPVDGAANAAVIDLIAGHFSCRRADVVIVSGHTSRTKVLQLPDGATPPQPQLFTTS